MTTRSSSLKPVIPTPIIYSVTGTQSGAVATGTYSSGSSINFNGISLNVEGTPANGDIFQVNRSQRQSVFQTVQAIADSLTVELDTKSKRAKLANDLGQALYSMDQALEHVQTKKDKCW